MKLLFIICMFWATILIEGVPNNYEIVLQPRGISDLPFFGWFYGSSTEDIHEQDAPNLSHQKINESNSDKVKLEKNDNVDQVIIKPDPVSDEAGSNQETNELDKWKSKDVNYHETDEKIKVIPVDKVGPNENPEPIENLLQNLKQEVNETSDEEKKNIATLLMDLNKTMKETSTNLAKVFINKTWHVFDIGALGTTRRTRNLEESISLLTPLYTLLGLFSQLLSTIGGNNLLLGNSLGGNNAQAGGLFQLLFPFLSNSQNGINQHILGGIAGLPGGQNHDSSKKVVVICIDDEHKKEANRLLHGKTPDAILSRIKEFLDKNLLKEIEQFYIIWKLHDLYDHLSGKNDETVLKLLKLIILIGEDPRFRDVFKEIKSKKEPEFDKIWKLFKHKPKLNEKYLTILRNLPQGKAAKLKAHPSRDCFIMGPDDHKSEVDDNCDLSDSDNDSDSDDEDTRSKFRKQGNLETYLMKLSSRGSNSKKDYYICCLDDEEELNKAKRILDGKTNDETIDNIRKKIERDDLSPEFKWYIILRLYDMLKDIEKDDKKNDNNKKDKDDKDRKDKDDKDKKDKDNKDKNDKEDIEKIIKLIVVIGENPKFEPFIKEIKSKDDPRFTEIWKLLKNEPRETKIEKSPEKENKDQKEVPKNSPDIVASPPKEEKVIKDEIKPNKDDKIVTKVETTPLPQNEIPKWIMDKSLLDILTLDQTTWEREFDPILRHIETKIKDPELNDDSRWYIVDILDRWYLGKFIPEPTFSQVKSKADGLVNLVKEDPKYDETFKKIEQKNPPRVTKRVFDLFGKKKEPEPNFHSQTGFYKFSRLSSDSSTAQETKLPPFNPYDTYYWMDKHHPPKNEYEYATLPLTYKIDTCITILENSSAYSNVDPGTAISRKLKSDSAYAIRDNNLEDFNNLDNVLLAQIHSNNNIDDLTIRVLRDFKNYLIEKDPSANGMRFLNGQERRLMQGFIDNQVARGKLTKYPEYKNV